MASGECCRPFSTTTTTPNSSTKNSNHSPEQLNRMDLTNHHHPTATTSTLSERTSQRDATEEETTNHHHYHLETSSSLDSQFSLLPEEEPTLTQSQQEEESSSEDATNKTTSIFLHNHDNKEEEEDREDGSDNNVLFYNDNSPSTCGSFHSCLQSSETPVTLLPLPPALSTTLKDTLGYYASPYLVFAVTLAAGLCTFLASWSCQTFYGADLSFGGGGYGIWSLQDAAGKCQLWSVLFFAYRLDAPLRAARFCTMVGMLLGLTSMALQSQLLLPYGRLGGWLVGIGLVFWLVDSLYYWWRFNVWASFFALAYFFQVLVIKCWVLEQYSAQTLYGVVRTLAVVTIFMTAGVFWILLSNVCLCDALTEEELLQDSQDQDDTFTTSTTTFTLEDGTTSTTTDYFDDLYQKYSSIGDARVYTRPEDCTNQCVLGPASNFAIVTPLLWVVVALLSYTTVPITRFSKQSGNQQARIRQRNERRLLQLASSASLEDDDEDDEENDTPFQEEEEKGEEISSLPTKKSSLINKNKKTTSSLRPRLGTATTFTSEDTPFNEEELATVAPPSPPSTLDSTSIAPLVMNPITEHPEHDTAGEEEEQDVAHNDTPEDEAEQEYFPDSTTITTETLHFARKPTKCRRCHHILLGIVSLLYTLVVLVLMGSYFENRNAAQAPDTSYNFITDVVCSLDPGTHQFETFETPDLAHLAGYQVVHCGECGECSNLSDIERYVETRKTVADSAKNCASVAIFGKDEALEECLQDNIGFTPRCSRCWGDNMRTTAKHCMWTCLSSMLIGVFESDNVPQANDYDWLNQCVYCDEKRSGPNFVQCSGVARRRLGIPSEFERNPLEQCPHSDIDYLQSNWTDAFLQDETSSTPP